MGAGSSSDYIKNTFLGNYLNDKELKEIEKYFSVNTITNGTILNNLEECYFLYIISGEITIYYINSEEKQINPANNIKILTSNTLSCLFDIENDVFESNRFLKLTLQCTSSNDEPTKYLSISKDKLNEFLSLPTIQPPIKSFFQVRPLSVLQTIPLFKGLSIDQLCMLESCMKYVPIENETAISIRGMPPNVLEGGYMAILFHGKCIQKHVPDPNGNQESFEPAPLLSGNSIHSIGSADTMSKSPSRRGSLLSARKRSTPRIVPTQNLQPGDRLLPIGSVIGAELCLRQDMSSFKTIVAQNDCIMGLLNFNDIERIDSIVPLTLPTLNSNLNYLFLENLTHSVPILFDITPVELFNLAKRCHILSVERDSPLLLQGEEGHRFYMILKGEAKVTVSPSFTSPRPSITTATDVILPAGSYFGELSLVLHKHLSASITILGGSVLLYLEKNDYLAAFSRNHQSIAEMSIRLQGIDTPLIHIMRHSRGYHNFLQYLQSELAPEGGIFWHRVDQLEDTCSYWLSQENPPQRTPSGINPKKYDPNMSTSRIKIPYPSSQSMSIMESTHEPRDKDSPFDNRDEAPNGINSVMDKSHQHKDHLKHILKICDEIMSQHIANGSQYQVNLPATMIRRIESQYRELKEKIVDSIKDESVISLPFYLDTLQSILTLFSQAKHEVFMLLKDDNYARWNKMESFQEFIQSMKPYIF